MGKYCPNCGAEVNEKAVSCIKCGGALNGKNFNALSGLQPPKTWLLESILVTLFCCLPFGIAGIVNASKVESRFMVGDEEGSTYASLQAGKWTKIGFWCGLAGIIIYVVLILAFRATLANRLK